MIAHLLYLFVLGVPAYRMRSYVNVHLQTIERAFMVFREAIHGSILDDIRLSGKLELDEAMFGGGRKGKHGWGAENKTIVFGIYKRNGRVVTLSSPTECARLVDRIVKHTGKGTVLHRRVYCIRRPGGRGMHRTVSHSRDEYVRDDAHINGMGGFWSYAKNWLYRYRVVPKQYFPLHLKEIEFRFNHRGENLFEVLSKILTKTCSK